MKPKLAKSTRIRILLLGLLFFAGFTAIGVRAVYIQIYRGQWWSQKAADIYEHSYVRYGKRGTIFDARGNEIAISSEATSIAAYPRRVTDRPRFVKTLSHALQIPAGLLKTRLAAERSFVWIKRQATPGETAAVRSAGLEGIGFLQEHIRFYPNRELAAPVVGFTGIDGVGLEGLEFYYDTYLRGRKVNYRVIKDAYGRDLDVDPELIMAAGGDHLVLTIDYNLQHVAEEALQQSVAQFGAKSGMAVVMEPETGAIRAMAQYPSFNPNSFGSYDKRLWRNRVITDRFEPGSTMKIFSAAAAIESGACQPNTIFYCENGAYTIGGNTIHDTKAHGWLSLQQILKHSSNIGAAKVSEKTGPEALYKTLSAFGFGQRTDIDCPGETSGRLSPYLQWTPVDLAAISFGQGIAVSAIQLVAAVSALANGGVLMRPYIVNRITDSNGKIIQRFGPRPVRQAVSASTARSVARMMQTVVSEGGTGYRAAIAGYDVSGKTGTAQKISEQGGYAEEKFIASFVGFFPAQKPEATILVVIDEPVKQHYGGIVAVPVFRKIAESILTDIHPDPQGKPDRFRASNSTKVRG